MSATGDPRIGTFTRVFADMWEAEFVPVFVLASLDDAAALGLLGRKQYVRHQGRHTRWMEEGRRRLQAEPEAPHEAP